MLVVFTFCLFSIDLAIELKLLFQRFSPIGVDTGLVVPITVYRYIYVRNP